MPGTILKLELQKNICYGLVDELSSLFAPPRFAFAVKPALEIVDLSPDQNFVKFSSMVAKLYCLQSSEIYTICSDFLSKQRGPKKNSCMAPVNLNIDEQLSLTQPTLALDFLPTLFQQSAIDQVAKTLAKGHFAPFLLHGVTGSGKTLVYKNLILQAADAGQSSIFLLPEIGLCEQFFTQFKKLEDFGRLKVLRYHSLTPPSACNELFQALEAKIPILLFGVHLPIFLPLQNLGLIIVDEEHEAGFAKQNWPHFDSKQMAILRASCYRIPIVLGSATPTVGTLFAAKTQPWQILTLPNKFTQSTRQIELVPLLPKTGRKDFWLTPKLLAAIQNRLDKGEQAIVFLNRRGHSLYAQCQECSLVLQCQNCSISLTVHHKSQAKVLACHYCQHQANLPSACPGCKKTSTFWFKGIGTQKLAELLAKHFPAARIARIDLDSAKEKKDWPKIAAQMNNHELDILVGTQAITKGYNFPNVTLVGVIWADLDFNFPVYQAHEQAVQRLLQVIGRTARGNKPGQIILQFLRQIEPLENLSEEAYLNFCQQELAMRENAGFPPFQKFYQLQLNHKILAIVEAEAIKVASQLAKLIENMALPLEIIGPFAPGIDRLQGKYLQEIIIKGSSFKAICQLLERLEFCPAKGCQISFKPMF